jgi:hypothetical protein
MDGRIETRTAKDPEAFVAAFGDSFQWAGQTYRVELVSVDGVTKSGRKKFTIRYTKVEK